MMVSGRSKRGCSVNLITTVTLIGVGLYVLRLAISLVVGVARGQIDPEDIEAVSRGWGSVDSDVYDGEWGTRDGGVWCDWCHRYHE
jgi:hypothetical protein